MGSIRPSEAFLTALERTYKSASLVDADAAKEVLDLIKEIRRLRGILDGIYELVQETPGREEQLAELEREVVAIRGERTR